VPRPRRLRSAVEQTRREAKRLAREARQAGSPGGSSVRFSGRQNIVATANSAEPGSTRRSIGIQSTAIDQDGDSA
jgi:hypothetical protein